MGKVDVFSLSYLGGEACGTVAVGVPVVFCKCGERFANRCGDAGRRVFLRRWKKKHKNARRDREVYRIPEKMIALQATAARDI